MQSLCFSHRLDINLVSAPVLITSQMKISFSELTSS